MTTLLLAVLLVPQTLAQPPRANVRDRSEPVAVALEAVLQKNRSAITAEDLATVTDLKLPHIHIKSFKDIDFAGMPKLKKLHFYSLLHNNGTPKEPIAIGNKVFAELSNLEELIMAEQLGLLPDDVFSGLTSLRVLNLSSATLKRLPSSMLSLPKLEVVYFDGRGLSKEDLATLKSALGNKLQPRKVN